MKLALILSVLLLIPAACGGDDDDDVSIDGAPGTQIDGAPGADSGGDPIDSGSKKLCGGLTGLECEGNDYCDYEDNSCGNTDALGACLAVPSECEPGGPSVCGCDGQSYENKCFAAMAGTDVAEASICK
jgi:hypothetical protein